MIEDGRTRKMSRISRAVNRLSAGLFFLFFLAAPFCVAILIELGAWPMIPVAVLWIPLGLPLFSRLPTYVTTAARYLILGRSRTPSRLRQRIVKYMLRLEIVWIVAYVYTIFLAPGVFATLLYGLLPGEAVVFLIFATGPIYGWFSRRAGRKEEAKRAAEEELLRARKCPQCDATHGADAVVVFYGSSARARIPSEADLRHVIVQCAKCRYMQVLSAAGDVLDAFQPDEEWLRDLP